MVRPRTLCLLLALVTVLVYSPVRHAGFLVFDDSDYAGDRHVQSGLTAEGVKWAFTTFHASNWHPLTWLSHMLDARLFGPNPGPQHFVNVLFHAANAVLLFVLLFRLTNKLWPAAFVAALFAWHPLHVESVAWISERKDVLSMFFGLLTLMTYVGYAQKSTAHNPQSTVRYITTLVLFALGLMAKPMLVTLPCVMLLLDIWPLGRLRVFTSITEGRDSRVTEHETGNTKIFIEKVPFFILTAVSCILTYLAQRTEAVMSLEQRPLGLRVENAVVSYAEYLGKAIWPAKLAVIYPLPTQIPAWQIGAAAVLLAVISAFAWAMRKRAPYVLIGWLWFLGTLVPVIGLVQVGGQALADRYTYFPLIGVFIAIGFGAMDLAARFRISTAALAAAATLSLGACLAATAYQLRFWQDSEALFTRAIAVTKDNAIAHINLGVALEQADHRQEALAEYKKAVEIDPNRFQGHNNYANLLAATGERQEAFNQYQEALRLNPNAELAHVNFGTLLSEMGRFEDAMREYTEATQLAPEDPRPHYLMGKACLRHGQSAEAVKHFRQALQLDANDFQTLTWLARVLAADRDASLRNATEALQFSQQANDLTGGAQPFVLDTLGMACAEAGHFQDAQAATQKAIDLAKAAGAEKTLAAMQQRLQLYQSGQPYREDFAKNQE